MRTGMRDGLGGCGLGKFEGPALGEGGLRDGLGGGGLRDRLGGDGFGLTPEHPWMKTSNSPTKWINFIMMSLHSSSGSGSGQGWPSDGRPPAVSGVRGGVMTADQRGPQGPAPAQGPHVRPRSAQCGVI